MVCVVGGTVCCAIAPIVNAAQSAYVASRIAIGVELFIVKIKPRSGKIPLQVRCPAMHNGYLPNHSPRCAQAQALPNDLSSTTPPAKCSAWLSLATQRESSSWRK